MTLVLAAIAPVFSEDMAFVLQVKQCPVVVVTTQNDAAALSSVAAIGATVGVILHMAQVHRALATLARTAVYLDVVYEIRFHQSPFEYH